MIVTKEQVLESMNTYCTERKYGSETLTDGFKENFANSFVKKYGQQDVDENLVNNDLHFSLDSAFNSAVSIKSQLETGFKTKEDSFNSQIAELNKKLGITDPPTPPTPPNNQTAELPEGVKKDLDDLKKFKLAEAKKQKIAEIVAAAKPKLRKDLQKSFETFLGTQTVDVDKDSAEQAESLISTYKAVFKDSIGDITPKQPTTTKKELDEYLQNFPKVTVE